MFYELYHLNLADNSPTLSGKMCKMCDPNLKHCSCSCGLDECGSGFSSAIPLHMHFNRMRTRTGIDMENRCHCVSSAEEASGAEILIYGIRRLVSHTQCSSGRGITTDWAIIVGSQKGEVSRE